MSCYLVSDDHINAMISWAQWNNVEFRVKIGFEPACRVDYDFVRQELRKTNEKSYQTRYAHRDDISMEHEPVIGKSGPALPAIEILKLCACYDYQACEFDGWKTSDAKAFVQYLRNEVTRALPGYEQAPWSI